MSALEWRGPMIIIMRATLHDHAPNTYYGQWTHEEAAISGHRFAGQCPRRRAGSGAFQRRSGSCLQIPEESRPATRESLRFGKKKDGRSRPVRCAKAPPSRIQVIPL
jgi:hypothetical protein